MRLIREALEASKDEDEASDANDQAVFASKFENVTTLARHSLSQTVRRILGDATIAQAGRLPVDFVKALLNDNEGRDRHLCALALIKFRQDEVLDRYVQIG